MTIRIGIDTGGTFTDLVVADGATVHVAAKSLTTHDDLAEGLLNSLAKAELDGGDAAQIVHGTTVALNAILTRRGADVGLITTGGFRDLLDMGRAWRPAEAITDPRWRRPHEVRPIVERARRRSVHERVAADGEVLAPLDEERLLHEAAELYDDGCRSIAVCFLHAYKHPEHEQRAAALIRERFPDVSVSTSSEIAPFPKEYNRLSTCVLNAYARPLMESYTTSIAERLAAAGQHAPLAFMTNDGGLSDPATVSRKPVTTLNSGPVGGVMGVQTYARMLEMPNLVGFDMGGTSTDVAVIADGRASTQRELELEHDLIVSMPVLEIHSIGAGGGSIASLDPAGGLEVGPESAGSDPGPACYGRGGQAPTVTDALLLLGWLDPETPLGGEIRPEVAAAERAYAPLAKELGATPLEVASTVVEVGIHNMAEAIRHLTVYRGVDARDFGLLAYGAAGPLAATQVARVLQMPRVVLPALAGVFSAFGLLEGATFEEAVLPIMAVASDEVVGDVLGRMREEAARMVGTFDGDADLLHVEFYLDAMYLGQRWELPALVDPGQPEALAHLQEAFAEAHTRQFGYSLPAPIYVASGRVRVVSAEDRAARPSRLTAGSDAAPRAHRTLVIGGQQLQDVPVLRADDLAPGQIVRGPAVLEGSSYTGVLVDGDVARVTEVGDIIVDLEESA